MVHGRLGQSVHRRKRSVIIRSRSLQIHFHRLPVEEGYLEPYCLLVSHYTMKSNLVESLETSPVGSSLSSSLLRLVSGLYDQTIKRDASPALIMNIDLHEGVR